MAPRNVHWCRPQGGPRESQRRVGGERARCSRRNPGLPRHSCSFSGVLLDYREGGQTLDEFIEEQRNFSRSAGNRETGEVEGALICGSVSSPHTPSTSRNIRRNIRQAGRDPPGLSSNCNILGGAGFGPGRSKFRCAIKCSGDRYCRRNWPPTLGQKRISRSAGPLNLRRCC